MERLNPWNAVIAALGRNLEELGKIVRTRSAKNETLSIDDLKILRINLEAYIMTIDQRIESLEEGNQD